MQAVTEPERTGPEARIAEVLAATETLFLRHGYAGTVDDFIREHTDTPKRGYFDFKALIRRWRGLTYCRFWRTLACAYWASSRTACVTPMAVSSGSMTSPSPRAKG